MKAKAAPAPPALDKFVWDSFTIVKPLKRPKGIVQSYRARMMAYAVMDLGGEGSGNFDHAGRPGQVGGSAPGGSGHAATVTGAGSALADVARWGHESKYHKWPDGPLWYDFGLDGVTFDTPTGDAVPAGKVPLKDMDYNTGGGGVELTQYLDSITPPAPPGYTKILRIADRPGLKGRNAANAAGMVEFIDQTTGGDETLEWGFQLEQNPDLALYTYHVKLPDMKQRYGTRQEGGRGAFAYGRSMGLSRHFDDAWHPVHLGGTGSGNFGHAGRPGEVGGSASSTSSVRELTEADKTYIDANFAWKAVDVDRAADKRDGMVIFPKMFGLNKAPTEEQKTEVFGTHDPNDIVMQMVQGMPGDVTVHVTQGKNSKYPFATVVDVYMVASSTKASREREGYDARLIVGRQFIREADGTLTVYEDAIEVKRAQGKGIAKTVLSDAMRTYQQLGVEKVEMIANLDVGGYAWAKFGFKANDPAELADTLSQRVTEGRLRYGTAVGPTVLEGVSAADKAALHAVITTYKDDPKLPWHIANTVTSGGRMVGKQILLEANWPATLRLDDAEGMKKFDAYVNRQ